MRTFLVGKDGAMPSEYDEETKAKTIRLFRDHAGDYDSPWAAMCAISGRRGPWETGGRMSTANRRAVRRRNGLPNWRIVRYADDFGTTKWYGYTFIDDRAVRSLKAKIRALTRRTSQLDPEYGLTRLNQVMHGWANYFRHAVAKNTFGMLDNFAWRRVIRVLMTRHHWKWKDVRRLCGGREDWSAILAAPSERCRPAAMV
jgi:Group II intron, maturase-specific domain